MNDSSYLKDFAAGVEPTGVYTFRHATNNKENHVKHKLVGDLGGFAGGFVISTGLSAAGMAGTAIALKKELQNYLNI